MLSLQTMRIAGGTPLRRGLGLLAIVWLNLALTPCALAFDAAKGCAHNPQSGHHEMAGHHEHGEQKTAHPCASVQESCCEIADANTHTRGATIELDDSSDLEALAGHPPDQSANRVLARYQASTDPPDPPAGSRPLHKLFCVYLN